MGENLEEQANILGPNIIGPHRPFSREQEREWEMQRVEELKPTLEELEYWRARSVYGPCVFYGCAA